MKLPASMQRRLDCEAEDRALRPDWTGKMIGPWPKVRMPFIFEPFRQYPGRCWHGEKADAPFPLDEVGLRVSWLLDRRWKS